jgi:hypothetical protein
MSDEMQERQVALVSGHLSEPDGTRKKGKEL